MKSASSFAAPALLPVQSLPVLSIGKVTVHYLRYQERVLIDAIGLTISRKMAELS